MKAYHFSRETLRNGAPLPAIGEWLEHKGPIIPCQSGLHASVHPLDALKYAPGSFLHLVELEGDLVEHEGDKWVGRRRKIVASIDATPLLREFSRWCALQVIHLWDAPDVVRQYLETGDESIRQDASAATWCAPRSASESAAESAARFSARYAARHIAKSAAKYAARSAAFSVTEVPQRRKFKEMVEAAM